MILPRMLIDDSELVIEWIKKRYKDGDVVYLTEQSKYGKESLKGGIRYRYIIQKLSGDIVVKAVRRKYRGQFSIGLMDFYCHCYCIDGRDLGVAKSGSGNKIVLGSRWLLSGIDGKLWIDKLVRGLSRCYTIDEACNDSELQEVFGLAEKSKVEWDRDSIIMINDRLTDLGKQELALWR